MHQGAFPEATVALVKCAGDAEVAHRGESVERELVSHPVIVDDRGNLLLHKGAHPAQEAPVLLAQSTGDPVKIAIRWRKLLLLLRLLPRRSHLKSSPSFPCPLYSLLLPRVLLAQLLLVELTHTHLIDLFHKPDLVGHGELGDRTAVRVLLDVSLNLILWGSFSWAVWLSYSGIYEMACSHIGNFREQQLRQLGEQRSPLSSSLGASSLARSAQPLLQQ
jgi:hypothetical protein